MSDTNYKPNSHKSKEEPKVEKKKVEKVVTGKVKVKKKGELRKLADVFVPEDINDVKSYIMSEVVVPAIKKTISEIVESILYPGGKRKHGGSKISYARYYEERDRDRRPARTSGGYDFDNLILDSRGEAEEVLNKMDELLDVYGVVSVGDLYDLAGISNQSNYTDNRYGWTNLRTASVVRVRDGYMIKLPRVMPID